MNEKLANKKYCKKFKELSLHELYTLMELRQKVFIVEQNCAYLDADNFDFQSYHILYKDEFDKLIAYARIIPPDLPRQHHVSIGRVLVHKDHRSKGLGADIMERSVQKCRELFPEHQIKISAQSYLVSFYERLGFMKIGEEYLEDGIPHIAMLFLI